NEATNVRITGQSFPDRGPIGRPSADRDYRMSTYGLPPHSTHCYGRRPADLVTAGEVRARPAICGALGRASVNFGVDGAAPADLTVTGLAKALPYSCAEQERRIGLRPQYGGHSCTADCPDAKV